MAGSSIYGMAGRIREVLLEKRVKHRPPSLGKLATRDDLTLAQRLRRTAEK